MELTIEFCELRLLPPERVNKREYSDELLVVDDSGIIYHARYDFENKVFEDLMSYSEKHGYAKLCKIKQWAYWPGINPNSL